MLFFYHEKDLIYFHISHQKCTPPVLGYIIFNFTICEWLKDVIKNCYEPEIDGKEHCFS